MKATHFVREGTVTDAKLTVSGGEIAVMASYRPLLSGGGGGSGISGKPDSSSSGSSVSGAIPAQSRAMSTVLIFLVDLKSLRLLPQHVRHDWSTSTTKVDGLASPVFAVSPVLDLPGSDYVYLMMGTSIRVFSFETGQEVVLRGGSRLSAYVRGGDQGTAGAGAGAGAGTGAGAAAVVAASASSDNKTLAVACAGSGVVLVFRLRDDSAESEPHQHLHQSATSISEDSGLDAGDSGGGGHGGGSGGGGGGGGSGGAGGPSWQAVLRGMRCDRRDATPWEVRVRNRATLPFTAELERYGHRAEVGRIVSDTVEAAMVFLQKKLDRHQHHQEVLEFGGIGGVSAAGGMGVGGGMGTGGSGAGGRVSLRALLGKPPYGTV